MQNTISLVVNMNTYRSHENMVTDIGRAFFAGENDVVNIDVDLNTDSILYGDYLVILVCLVKYLRSRKIRLTGKFISFNPDTSHMQYASRIDFFKHMDIPIPENFLRHDSSGKFTEITTFQDTPSVVILNKRITDIFNANMELIDESVLYMLDYSISEILDNVLGHSNSIIHG